MTLEEEIVALYDEEVARHPDGVKTAEAKKAIRERVAELLQDTPRDTEGEAQDRINRVVGLERDRRANRIKRDLDYVLDYLTNPDEAALIPDPLMDMAFRLGEADGSDKSLRNWTPEDFTFLGQQRVKAAKEAEEAAEALEATTLRVVYVMRDRGVNRFGDLR